MRSFAEIFKAPNSFGWPDRKHLDRTEGYRISQAPPRELAFSSGAMCFDDAWPGLLKGRMVLRTS